MRKIIRGLFITAAVLIIFSCENPIAPFDAAVINQVKDSTTPEIKILSPQPGGTYSSTVVVEGIVNDTGSSSTGEIKSVAYLVLNTDIEGQAEMGVDNRFSFSFSSVYSGSRLSGTISILITAIDWNDNEATYTLNLNNDSGNFSYFEVEVGNKSATVFWTEIPSAESYAIIYTDDGSEPSEGNGILISVPVTLTVDSEGIFSYTIDELENGILYKFKLLATCTDGQKNFSSSGTVIPLSTYFLYPSVRTGFETIELTWLPMEGADSYRVYRSTEREGTYEDVSGLISRTNYKDKNLVPGEMYFYKIAPSIEGSIMSEPKYASPNGMKLRPEILASVSVPMANETGASDSLLELAVVGNYAYGLLQYGGLVVYDISSPSNPRQVFTDRYTIGGQHYYTYGKITVYDGYLYISCCSSGISNGPDKLLVYSLVNTGEPELVNVLNTNIDFYIYDFIPYNDYLYIGSVLNTNTAGIQVLDISSPEDMTFASNLTENDLNLTTLRIEGMTVHNGELYISNRNYYSGTYLYIYDITTPTKTTLLGSSSGLPASFCGGVYVEGDEGAETAYILGGNRRFQVLDASNPSSISETASYNVITDPQALTIYNGYAYITYGSGTLQYIGLNGSRDDDNGVFTISDGRIMVTNGTAQDIVYSGGYLWVADGPGGLTVVEPASFGTLSAGNEIDLYAAKRMTVDGEYAYIAEGLEGVRVLSISGSGSLSEVATVDPVLNSSEGIIDVAVHGKYLYAACYASNEAAGLFVYDVETPSEPQLAGKALSYAKKLDVAGNLVFAILTDTVLILDSSDPENPVIISSLVLKGATELKAQGDYLYVYYSINSPSEAGIATVNISNPYKPRITGTCKTGTASGDGVFALTENYAYVGKQDLYIVDISNPETLSDEDQIEDSDDTSDEGWNFWNIDYSIFGLDTDGRYLYLSVRTPNLIGEPQMLAVLDCSNGEKPVLIYEMEADNGKDFCLLDGEHIYLNTGSGKIRNYNLDYWD